MSLGPQRQLVKPSKFQPWGVQVVSVVPESVHDILDDSGGVVGAVTRGWSAVALEKEGKIHAFPVKTATLSQPLNPAQHGHKLYHPGLAGTSPLLALSAKDQGAHVHVYAASPKDGSVYLWRLSHEERTQILPRKPQSRVMLPLQQQSDDDNDSNDDERVSCLSSDPLVIGTSWGRLFWCIETAQPLMLHAQLMERPSTSMLSRFLLSSSSSIVRQEPIHSVLRLDKENDNEYDSSTSSSSILSVSASGTLEHWTVSTMAASHKANFQVKPVTTLREALAPHFPKESSRGGGGVKDVSVMTCNSMPHDDKDDGTTHGLNFIVRLTLQEEEESRIYWLQGILSNKDNVFELNHALYLNRFHASQVDCVGLVTTHEHLSYAAFQYNNNDSTLPVTVMALMDDSTLLHEVDLPMALAPLLVKGTMGRDTVTHGWCALATSGLGLRGRWTGLQFQAATSATPMKRKSSSSAQGSPSNVATLTIHLRSAFWHWYQNYSTSNNDHDDNDPNSHNNRQILTRLPPSLRQASREDLEPAILATAAQLQHEGDSSSLHNPTKWHNSFLELLRDGGLYRSLSSDGRYALLGIGQELVVYQALLSALPTQSMQNKDSSCQPHGIADWLQALQDKALKQNNNNNNNNSVGGGQPFGDHRLERFEELLVLALQTATQYRHEHADTTYDISNVSTDSTQPTRLWTHHPTLQHVMTKQMQVWQNATTTTTSMVVHPKRLVTLVRAALSSFCETKHDVANGQERYHDMKVACMALLQQHMPTTNNEGDEIAFELSVEHEYYQGICEISHRHNDDDNDTNGLFRMEPLLAKDSPLITSGGRDFKTGLDFERFVLEWYADRGLYAHVLNYGQCCDRQEVLSRFLETNPRMHGYQWIPAIRNQQLDAASRHLFQDAMRPDETLASCHWSLSMAKLSNMVAQEEKSSKVDLEIMQELKRQRTDIENKMELVQAQQLLFMDDNDDSEVNRNADKQGSCLPPEDLLFRTLKKLQETQEESSNTAEGTGSNSEAIQLCLIGLAICRSVHGRETRQRLASRVWSQSILTDMSSWKDLIRNQHHTTKPQLQQNVLHCTIFGQVLDQYVANINNNNNSSAQDDDAVVYDGGSMEKLVLDQLGMEAVDMFEMKRLLRIGTHLVLPTERPMSM